MHILSNSVINIRSGKYVSIFTEKKKSSETWQNKLQG